MVCVGISLTWNIFLWLKSSTIALIIKLTFKFFLGILFFAKRVSSYRYIMQNISNETTIFSNESISYEILSANNIGNNQPHKIF